MNRGLRSAIGILMVAGCSHRDLNPSTTATPDLASAVDFAGPVDLAGLPGLVFRFAWRSDVPSSVYVQSSTESGGQGWVSVLDATGSALPIQYDCAICRCDFCPACSVCGAGLAQVTPVKSGGSVEWAWDAITWPRRQDSACPTRECNGQAALPPGPYRARFCFSRTVTMDAFGAHVGATVCGEIPFDYPVPGGVVDYELCECG